MGRSLELWARGFLHNWGEGTQEETWLPPTKALGARRLPSL